MNKWMICITARYIDACIWCLSPLAPTCLVKVIVRSITLRIKSSLLCVPLHLFVLDYSCSWFLEGGYPKRCQTAIQEMTPKNKHRGVESVLTLYYVSGATKIWLLPAHPHEFGTNYNKTVTWILSNVFKMALALLGIVPQDEPEPEPRTLSN